MNIYILFLKLLNFVEVQFIANIFSHFMFSLFTRLIVSSDTQKSFNVELPEFFILDISLCQISGLQILSPSL